MPIDNRNLDYKEHYLHDDLPTYTIRYVDRTNKQRVVLFCMYTTDSVE